MKNKNKNDRSGGPIPSNHKSPKKDKKDSKDPKSFFSRSSLLYLLIVAILVAVVIYQSSNAQKESIEIPTSDFIAAVEEERIDEFTYHASNGEIEGQYWADKKDIGNEKKLEPFASTFSSSQTLNEFMLDNPGVKFETDVSTPTVWTNILISFLPILLLIGVMVYFINQMQGPGSKSMQFGKTKTKLSAEEVPDVKFSDVAGIDEALEELMEVKDFLVNPEKFERLGAKIPRGVLLVGPPGTGKTLLAKAVAGESGVPFFPISGSDFVEMFVGVGASRVRDLFKQAKESAPAIIFIDEIDAVGRQRGAGLGGGHDEREQTLNQLLVEMDGFDEHDTVILLAATNRPDILDPALLRPGRFDRQITVDRPDQKGRIHILKVHSKNKPIAKDVQFETIAGLTTGFTGADLANLMNEAALLAARKNKKEITMDEVTESMERVVAGPERKSRAISEKEKRTIAYHESGHAIVGHVLDNTSPVHKISIVARGQALGYTLQIPEEDRYLKSRGEMRDELAVFMGGRVSEEIFCNDITTGASNDLERATKMAREMVTRYGFSEALGHQVYGESQHEVFLGRDYADKQDYSQATAEKIDREVKRLMNEAHERATDIIVSRRNQIELMVSVLYERETIEGEEVKALLNNEWDEYLEKEARGEVEKKSSDDEDSDETTEEDKALNAKVEKDIENIINEAEKNSGDVPVVHEVDLPEKNSIEVNEDGRKITTLEDGSTYIIEEDGTEIILPPKEEDSEEDSNVDSDK